MINLLLDEPKLVAKNKDIKDYKNKSEEDLIKILSEPKSKIIIPKKKIKEIKKDFSELRHKFSKSEINNFRKSLYDIKKHRNLSEAEIREAEKNLIELENSLQFKKFHNYDYDDEYKKIRSVKKLFKQSDRDYFKPIKTIDSFDNIKGYAEYRSRGDKYENLSPKEYLDMIRPHLRDMINDNKAPMKLPDKVLDDESQFGEWKIQLKMRINCISSDNFK